MQFWNQHGVGVRRDQDSNQKARRGLVQDIHLWRVEKIRWAWYIQVWHKLIRVQMLNSVPFTST